MQKYTKAILAFAGILLPLLEQIGVPLPTFLTLDWLQGLLLLLTPAAVYFFPNKDPDLLPYRVRSPASVSILALLLACFMLASCGIQRPHIDSAADAIAVTSADIETAAQTVKDLCQNIEPGGPCAPTSIISTQRKESFKVSLQKMLDTLRTADLALTMGQEAKSDEYLARTESMLLILKSELARYQ